MSRAIRSSSSSPGDGLVDGLRTGLLALAIAGCGGAADEGGEAQSGERVDAGVAAYSLSAPVEDAERTRIFVLGTQHLGALGEAFDPSILSRLLDALEA